MKGDDVMPYQESETVELKSVVVDDIKVVFATVFRL